MPELNSAENPQLSEIEELEKQLAEKKAAANIESVENPFERQLEIARENFPELQAQTLTPTTASVTVSDDEIDGDKARDVQQDVRALATMDETRKMETLVAIALDKGINHAVEVANNLRDPYILDLLHDKLIGELHDKLVSEKKLKEI